MQQCSLAAVAAKMACMQAPREIAWPEQLDRLNCACSCAACTTCCLCCAAHLVLLTSCNDVQTNGGSGGVKSVQVKGPNSSWKGLQNIFGAEWETGQQPSLPIDLHITADSGSEVGQDMHSHHDRCASPAGSSNSGLCSQQTEVLIFPYLAHFPVLG